MKYKNNFAFGLQKIVSYLMSEIPEVRKIKSVKQIRTQFLKKEEELRDESNKRLNEYPNEALDDELSDEQKQALKNPLQPLAEHVTEIEY